MSYCNGRKQVMKKQSKTKLAVTIFLILLLMPIATGIFCKCCEAGESTQLLIQATPSHNCCPDQNLNLSSCERLGAQKFTLMNSFKDILFRLSEFWNETGHLSSILDFSSSNKTHSEAYDYFSPPLSQPLYLSLQVLRI